MSQYTQTEQDIPFPVIRNSFLDENGARRNEGLWAREDVGDLRLDPPDDQASRVSQIIILVLASGLIAGLLAHRIVRLHSWRRIPYMIWLVFGAYVNTFIFNLAAAILRFGMIVNTIPLCQASAIICTSCYVIVKCVYMFLVDRAHIALKTEKSRRKSKLYIFHLTVVTAMWLTFALILLIFRLDVFVGEQCLIGEQQDVLMASIAIDFVINAYLTGLFLFSLLKYHPFWNRDMPASRDSESTVVPWRKEKGLRNLTKKTFVGSAIGLGVTMANLIAMAIVNGEPVWLCLTTCILDLLINCVVLHWLTTTRNINSGNSRHSNAAAFGEETGSDFRNSAMAPGHSLPVPAPAQVSQCSSCAERVLGNGLLDSSTNKGHMRECGIPVLGRSITEPESGLASAEKTFVVANDSDDAY